MSRYAFRLDGVGNRTLVTETLAGPGTALDVVFADGFESGNFAAWSAAVTDGGDLSVSSAAALIGTYGLQAVIDDTTPIYARDDTPTAEPRYRVRFSFDPNSVTLPAGEDHDILDGRTNSATVFRVQLLFVNSAYHLRVKVRNDAGSTPTPRLFRSRMRHT